MARHNTDFRWASALWGQMVEVDIYPLEAEISCPRTECQTVQAVGNQTNMSLPRYMFVYIFSFFLLHTFFCRTHFYIHYIFWNIHVIMFIYLHIVKLLHWYIYICNMVFNTNINSIIMYTIFLSPHSTIPPNSVNQTLKNCCFSKCLTISIWYLRYLQSQNLYVYHSVHHVLGTQHFSSTNTKLVNAPVSPAWNNCLSQIWRQLRWFFVALLSLFFVHQFWCQTLAVCHPFLGSIA